jgi:hypothetical protein
LNVKSIDKGHHNWNSLSDLIVAVDCDQVKYLKNLHKWLEDWGALNQKAQQGRLSNETMFALKHTVATHGELVVYLFNDFNLSFISLGNFQTDSLEY